MALRRKNKYYIKKLLAFILSRDFLVFLVCLLLSVLFWYIVALNEDYEREFDLRLQLKNVPRNVVITTDLPSTVHITLKDRGSRLLSYKYYGGLPVVNVDFRNYNQHSGHVVLRSSDLSKLILKRLLPSTKISSFNPTSVEYYYNYGLHARLPIVLNANIQAERFYSVSGVRLYPDSVTVYATQEVLDTMTAAYTRPIYLSGVEKRTVRRALFHDVKGAKFSPSSTLLRVDVDQITEKTVAVPVRWTNFPASKVLRTFPSTVKVTFLVGMNMYEQINSNDFAIVVSYEDVLRSQNGKLHLSLKSIPAGVSHVRINPENIDYLIEDVAEEEI